MTVANTINRFLDQFLSDRTTFNLMFVMRFNGLVDVDKAEDMVNALGERHEIFRTTFYADKDQENQPTQAVMAKSRLHMEKQNLAPEQRPERCLRCHAQARIRPAERRDRPHGPGHFA